MKSFLCCEISPGPPSKRSLNFNEEERQGAVQLASVESGGTSSQDVMHIKKRGCDEMYSALPDEDSEEELDNIISEISGDCPGVFFV